MNQRLGLLHLVKERSAQGDVFFRPILMQFAAHHVGRTYREFYLDHEVLVAANLACMEAFGMDAVGLISDPYREAEAYGACYRYPNEGVPVCIGYPIKTQGDIEALQYPDVMTSARTRDRIEGARLYRTILGDDIPIIGWIEGPLAEACDLVGVAEMLLMLALEPDLSTLLLAKMVPTAKAFALSQIEAGCKIIGMGDAICSQISSAMYAAYIKALHDEIIAFIQEQGAMVKLHICGNITHLLPHIRDLHPDIVDIDWMVDLEYAYKVLGPDIIRSGNLDPVGIIEQMTADEVYSQTRQLVNRERGRAFILSGGCEITPLTPPENVRAMREASRLG